MLESITAGDTLELSYSNSEYPSSTYDLWIALRGLGLSEIDIKTGTSGVTITKTGDNFDVVVTAAATAAWLPGAYSYALYVYTTTTRYMVERGTVEIVPDFTAYDATSDTRSHAKTVLDAIEAVIENRATVDQMAYTIAGRSLSRMPVADLLVLRDRYRYEYQRELKAERVAAGLKPGGNVVVRF